MRGLIAVLGLACVPSACQPPPLCEQKTALVDFGAFTLVGADDDPFAPPANAPLCATQDVRVEPFGAGGPLALDVDTSLGCGWATARAPLLHDVHAGDGLQLRVFYFSQASFPSAQAEMALRMGEHVVWRQTVDIPTPAELLAPALTFEHDVSAGAPVMFHVGNHGDNTWNLLEVSQVTEAPCAP